MRMPDSLNEYGYWQSWRCWSGIYGDGVMPFERGRRLRRMVERGTVVVVDEWIDDVFS